MDSPATIRVNALARYSILGSASEDSFDAITKLASEICETPFAAISFAEIDRQWFKSEMGMSLGETPLSKSFCAQALSQDSPLIVEDAATDPRFCENEQVVSTYIRFYAGVQIRSSEGIALGVLCVLDTEPRLDGLAAMALSALKVLGSQVEAQLELRRAISERDAQVSALRQMTKDLRYLAGRDYLTSLPNRAAFSEKLAETIKECATNRSSLALMLIDVDHFKQINDSLGHDAGDALLRKFAANLAGVIRSSDMVARIGGDEFALLLVGADLESVIPAVVDSLHSRLNKPLRHRGRLIECRASIGIAQYPTHAKSVEALTKCSDLALAAAKLTRGSAVMFEAKLADRFDKRQKSVANVRKAFEADRLTPFYQPKVDFASGRVVGFEALMRQRTVLDGPVSLPEIFDPGFLDKGLLAQIRVRLTNQILDDVAKWSQAGVRFGHIAINSCAADFASDDLGESLLMELRKRMLAPSQIELEVTEGVFVGRGSSHVARALNTLCEAGVRIALDDFGTGYASLTHLKQFPVDVLKIDRSFVAGIGKGADDSAIVRAVIGLGKNLGIQTVAEGVETLAQASFLHQYGCTVGQGFLYGAAIPAEEVPARISLNASRLAA